MLQRGRAPRACPRRAPGAGCSWRPARPPARAATACPAPAAPPPGPTSPRPRRPRPARAAPASARGRRLRRAPKPRSARNGCTRQAPLGHGGPNGANVGVHIGPEALRWRCCGVRGAPPRPAPYRARGTTRRAGRAPSRHHAPLGARLAVGRRGEHDLADLGHRGHERVGALLDGGAQRGVLGREVPGQRLQAHLARLRGRVRWLT